MRIQSAATVASMPQPKFMHRIAKYIAANWSKMLAFNCHTLEEKVEGKKVEYIEINFGIFFFFNLKRNQL